MRRRNAKTSTTPRLSRHKASSRKRIAARVLLVLALVIGVMAVSDFVYNAYMRADCYPAEGDIVWGIRMPSRPVREGCGGELARRERLLQLDSAAILLAAALVITPTVLSRRIRKPGHG
jgi:hypothetical protein